MERAIEAATNGIVISDAQRPDMPIIYVNPAFEHITGYSRAEVIGRDARLLQGPATDRAVVAKLSRALAAWKPVRVELVNYTRAGTPCWLEIAMTPVADDRGWHHYWFAIERDITERKQAEQDLVEANSVLERRVAQRTRELQHTELVPEKRTPQGLLFLTSWRMYEEVRTGSEVHG
jgi:PAS domain S-box-containing protein